VARRSIGVILIATRLAGVIGTGWASAVRSGAATAWGPFGGIRSGPTCSAPALPGQPVDVVLSDMGGMMGGGMMGGHMLNVVASPPSVAAGDVSFRVWNAGMMVHEIVVMPMQPGGPGSRVAGTDGKVSEDGSLGEASNSCGEGAGDGIKPGASSWVTLQLTPGRYELMCNIAGHYAMGIYTQLDVT
jgi:uncharacterized cupredoxin-like copper-binding protein